MAAVLVNGSPTKEFEIKRGLRQGDPLSPFLFILAMEGLHLMIEKAKNVSQFQGAELDEKKLTWIQWRKTMANKHFGGLGIGSLYGFNRALLFKWKWRFLNFPSALWVKIIKSLYENDGGFARPLNSKIGNSVWSNILKVPKELKTKNIPLDEFIQKRVGNGRDTRFWEDFWIGSGPLKKSFHRIYVLDSDKEPTVCNRISLMPGDDWLRHSPRRGREKVQWDTLISLVQTHVSSDQTDRWIWNADGSGIFSVSNVRYLIDKSTLINGEEETRWNNLVPKKVNVFLWRLLLDKLPTRLNIMSRGIDIQSNLCSVCNSHVENIDHLMLHCQLAKDLWQLIGRWWNIDFPVSATFKDFLNWIDNINTFSIHKKVFNVVVITTAWSIWRYRNESIFGETKPKKSMLFDNIVYTAYLWVTSRSKKVKLGWNDFLQAPHSACNSL